MKTQIIDFYKNNKTTILISSGVLLFFVVLFFIFRRKKVNLKGIDARSAKYIQMAHPAIREDIIKVYNEAHSKNLPFVITSSLRTFAEQQKLYDQGRTEPGNIVTKAKPGQSWHNYGLAFDIVPKDGYNSKYWNQIAAIAKKHKFEWGDTFSDKPHFQRRYGMSTTKAQQIMANTNKTYIPVN